MIAVLLVVAAILVLVTTVHWYVWRRLVRDTLRRGGWPRRLGTAAVVGLPLCAVASMATERSGAPFVVQQVLAWPGMLWLALLIYLLLALLAGELVRPLLLRVLERRAARRASGAGVSEDVAEGDRRPAVPVLPDGAADDGDTAAAGSDSAEREAAVASLAQQVATAESGTAGAASAAEAGSGAVAPGSGPADPAGGVSRRLFVARAVAVGATAAAAATVGYGAYGVLGKAPKVKRVTVPLAKLPRSAHGYRIAVVSDIHLGPILGRGHTQRIVDTINRTNPDLVAVVGDLVDGSVEHLAPAADPLRQLESREGAYFVTGNHEYFSGAEEWVEHVRTLGLRPLQNARTELAGFDLAGVNDVTAVEGDKGADVGKALADRDTSRTAVLLAHQPVVIDDAVDHGVDLQLSGHTHGGQLWPGNFIAGAANPTLAGLERYGDTQLYVTRGAGAAGPPVRVGAESDITVIQLAATRA